jgi:hypothetical protein
MSKIWLFALPLALAACHPMNASAAARVQTSRAGAATAAVNYNYGPGSYIYADVLKPHGRLRGNGARQVATRLCDGGDSEEIGLAPFNVCMSAHGWRFAGFHRDARNYAASSDSYSYDSTPSPSGPDPSQAASDAAASQAALDSQAASNAQNDAAQQQVDAGMAAAQQTMNNAN